LSNHLALALSDFNHGGLSDLMPSDAYPRPPGLAERAGPDPGWVQVHVTESWYCDEPRIPSEDRQYLAKKMIGILRYPRMSVRTIEDLHRALWARTGRPLALSELFQALHGDRRFTVWLDPTTSAYESCLYWVQAMPSRALIDDDY
jgi:hypothetical protein